MRFTEGIRFSHIAPRPWSQILYESTILIYLSTIYILLESKKYWIHIPTQYLCMTYLSHEGQLEKRVSVTLKRFRPKLWSCSLLRKAVRTWRSYSWCIFCGFPKLPFNPVWHGIGKQEKCLSLEQPRSNFYNRHNE